MEDKDKDNKKPSLSSGSGAGSICAHKHLMACRCVHQFVCNSTWAVSPCVCWKAEANQSPIKLS